MTEPLTITNFGGPLTRRNDGKIDSGLAKLETSWGYDPYSKPGNLTWMEQPTSILTFGSVAGAIVTMKQRVEVDGLTSVVGSYVYAVKNDGTLYRINTGSDTPSIVGALAYTPSVIHGPDQVFYGATEKIFYGDDNGIQKINFDGSGPASIHGTGSVTAAVPRPMNTFLGKVYFGNGNNIGEIDSTELITTGARLSPALPTGTYVRDIDVTPDGNYMQITATRHNPDGGFVDRGLTPGMATGSYKFFWNGIDDGITSYESYDGTGLTASLSLGEQNYSIGYDTAGTAILNGAQKIISIPKTKSPFPSGLFSISNTLGLFTQEYDDSRTLAGNTGQRASLYYYGQFDSEVPSGLFRLLRLKAPVRNDFIATQGCVNVSNLLYFPTLYSYPDNIGRPGKIYFATIEASSTNPDNELAKLWSFSTYPVGQGSVVGGVYETQNQLFSKKVSVGEVRFYTEPLVANNSFSLEIVKPGSGLYASSVIAGKTFTVGSTVSAGDEVMRWTPQIPALQTFGFRITNLGTKNWVGMKLEADLEESGT